MTRIKIEAEDHHFFMMYGFLKGSLDKIKVVDMKAYNEFNKFLESILPQLERYRNDKYHPDSDLEDLK